MKRIRKNHSINCFHSDRSFFFLTLPWAFSGCLHYHYVMKIIWFLDWLLNYSGCSISVVLCLVQMGRTGIFQISWFCNTQMILYVYLLTLFTESAFCSKNIKHFELKAFEEILKILCKRDALFGANIFISYEFRK